MVTERAIENLENLTHQELEARRAPAIQRLEQTLTGEEHRLLADFLRFAVGDIPAPEDVEATQAAWKRLQEVMSAEDFDALFPFGARLAEQALEELGNHSEMG
jgi:hypothetical protein